jgi:hypothetical protein
MLDHSSDFTAKKFLLKLRCFIFSIAGGGGGIRNFVYKLAFQPFETESPYIIRDRKISRNDFKC